MNKLSDYTLHLADNALIMGQRNAEWCGHGPILEQDIALTNISLDLVGQARYFYQYAAELMGGNATEDSLAYLRTERAFKNCLLIEQPNGDWAQTILKQFFFSTYQLYLFTWLQHHDDEKLKAIAAKSLKEVMYHVHWSSEWVIRLGDGTEESRTRMLKAIDELWTYTGEFFIPSEEEIFFQIPLDEIHQQWNEKVKTVFEEATLPVLEKAYMQKGGKSGIHTEHLGYILSEMQYLQRTYPNSQW
jgi:ring-1,2-phenylacetyl-CoA epoxidase subunit PaaC